MNKTLVIGGSGFIGSHISEDLINQGKKVVILDKVEPSIPHCDYFDFNNEKGCKLLYKDCDEIIDLAHSTNPKTSYDDPIKDIYDNLKRTVLSFQLAKESRSLKKYIYFSSGGAVYGNINHAPIDETQETNPISPYGITKLAIEKYGLMYNQIAGLPIIILRPSNPYGLRQEANKGQGLITQMLFNIQNNLPITIFGGDEVLRDYIHIVDLVKAVNAISIYGNIGQIYNIGTGTGHSALHVLQFIVDGLKIKRENLNVTVEEKRPFDVTCSVLSFKKIFEECQWSPEIKLKDGILELVKNIKM